MTEWLISLASTPFVLGLGAFLKHVYDTRTKASRDAIGDWRAIADERKRDHTECLARVEAVEVKLDDCERRHDKMEGRFDELREELYRRYLDSDPPPERT